MRVILNDVDRHRVGSETQRGLGILVLRCEDAAAWNDGDALDRVAPLMRHGNLGPPTGEASILLGQFDSHRLLLPR